MRRWSVVLAVGLVLLATPAGFSQPENLAPLLGKVTPAVALVVAQQRGGQPIDTGTAFVVDSDGILLTALHVVALAEQISVRLPDHPPLGADVIAIDTVHDAAVLRVPSLAHPGPTPLALGDAASLQAGAGVVVVGYPLAQLDHPTVTVNQGIISVVHTDDGYIQIDAAVNPGDSGGPVLTLDGKVIGIVDASVEGAQNFNLAVPIDVGRALLQRAATALATAAPLALPLTAPAPVPINFASPGIGPHSHRDVLGAVCVPPPPHAALLSDVGVDVSVEGGLRVVVWLSWDKGAPLESPAAFASVDATTMRRLVGTLPRLDSMPAPVCLNYTATNNSGLPIGLTFSATYTLGYRAFRPSAITGSRVVGWPELLGRLTDVHGGVH